MPSRPVTRERFSFANLDEVLPPPDLISVQRDSFQWFLDKGLAEAFRDISPIEDFSGSLKLILEFDPSDQDLRPPPKFSVEECKEKDMTYAAPIFVRAQFQNANTGEIKEQTVFMGDFPVMTDRGTFIINGTERVVVSQLVRSPGVIFQPGRDAKTIVTGTVHPYRGEWIEFDVEAKPGKDITAGSRVARKRRLSLFTLLRALGYADEAFLERFVRHFQFLEPQWERERELAPSQEDALLEIYKRARPGEPPSVESARAYFENAFFNSKRYDLTRVGRYKLDRKLGPEIGKIASLFDIELDRPAHDQTVLSKSEVLAASTYLLHLAQGEAGYRLDDQDHFANRRVRSVGELIQNQVRVGLSRMERVVRERMTTQDVEAITPQTLINIRPVVAAIKEFFGSSQLSQFMDQTNPLAELTHKRRLSALGPGGLSRERAGFDVRDVHYSHYGRICPIETPEGPNIGLIGSLATFARVNEFGFIEAPFRRVYRDVSPNDVREGAAMVGQTLRDDADSLHAGQVLGADDVKRLAQKGVERVRIVPWVSDEIVFLSADEEDKYTVAQANAPVDESGHFTVVHTACRSRHTFKDLPVAEVDYMDVSPKQTVSVATALIPFLEHDDANRALMGSNMQRQAVPLLVTEAPIVGTGMESHAARNSGEMVISQGSGTVIGVSWPEPADDDRSVVKVRSGQDAGIGILVRPDDGGPDIWYGIHKFVRSNQGTCLSQRITVKAGFRAEAGSVLADGPSTDSGELALGRNVLCAFMPWEGYNFEDAILISESVVREDKYTSIHIEEFEIEARDTKLGPEDITRDLPNIAEESLKNLNDRGIIYIGAEVQPGDILVGKITPKGESELSAEERLLRAIFGEKAREVRDSSLRVPHGERGTVVDVKVFSRESGHELPPGVNELIRVYVAQKRKISQGDKMAGRHGNKGVIARILPEEDMPYLPDGTPVEIVLNPLGVPSRMNVGQVLETHLCWAAHVLGEKIAELISANTDAAYTRELMKKEFAGTAALRQLLELDDEMLLRVGAGMKRGIWFGTAVFDGAREGEIKALLAAAGLPSSGKTALYDGMTGVQFEQPVTVGYIYMLKLSHLVDDKIHARSIGPYSLITQQPLGGKAQFGGQRFGEMEVWALEAYGAAYILQELLTAKSDDVYGRTKIYEAIVKGEAAIEPGVPESFNVLIRELQSLCLDVELIKRADLVRKLPEPEIVLVGE